MIIDAHCHLGRGRSIRQTPTQLLREMDASGVDMAVICPLEQQIAVDNRRGNNAMLAACRAHPDRLRGMAVANPWYGARAVSELRRALDGGLVGLKVHASRQGHYVNDRMLDPLLREVEAVHGFVYLHLGTNEYSLPLEALDLARRFPAVTFILGHMGLQDIWWGQCWEVMRTCPNTIAETSHVAFTGYLLAPLKEYGPSRFVYGSDSPVGSMALERWKLDRLDLSGAEAITGGNMARLLGQRGALR